MTEREQTLLASLALQCGILDGYHDIWGEYHPTEPESQREILRAMGLRVDSLEDLEGEIRLRESAPAHRLCEPVVTVLEGQPQEVRLTAPGRETDWAPSAVTHGHPIRLREIEREASPAGTERVRIGVALASPLPSGLHDVEVSLRSTSAAHTARTLFAVVPERGHEPDALARSERIWGVNLPLYGVRSARNWGIGDFDDLCRILEWSAGLGADMVGLLPLHSLFNSLPYGVSPYYPSSRLFLNPIHIAVDRVREAREPEVSRVLEDDATRREIQRLRASELVDHESVWSLKRRVLERCYRVFCAQHLEGPNGPSERGLDFEKWRTEQGPPLAHFTVFSALRDSEADGGGSRPWDEWADGLRRADSPAVEAFSLRCAREVGFYAYLQWLAEEQLARARDRAKELGMAVGLYLDLALGVDPCGADAWMYRDVLALEASAGAPPDPFSLLGQRWGVPPIIPERHRESGYRFFLESLGRNARRCGALRIDHVLALWRLFWIPGNLPAAAGAYVADRADELLALLRLVSRDEQCLIVGEDLGTVPPEVREALMSSGFYSYRLLIFEKEGDGRYRRPGDYPRQALVSVATHDLPTLDGFWLGSDLEVKRELNRYPDAEAEGRDAEERRWDRLRLLETLETEGLLPAGLHPAHEVPAERLNDLAEGVHAYLARTPSALMLANLDDLLGGREMQNLPDTLDEHPNWRRKCPTPIEEWGASLRAQRIAQAIQREGRGSKE